MISDRASNVNPSLTLSITAKAKQMIKQGKDIVLFGAGEPDFDTPEHIKQAAIKAINEGFTKYTATAGIPELRQAICQKFKKDNNLDYEPNQVLVSNGGKHSIYNLMQAMINKGDEVIIPVPYWVSYPEQVKLAEGKPVFVKTDKNNKLKSDSIEITKKTKLILLNSPNNPSGATIEKNELKKIADLAIENNIHVLSDEVYEHFVFEGKHYSIAALNNEIKQLTITLNAVSKTYSMTGWRIGYVAGPKDIISVMNKIQSHNTSNPCSIAQKAALAALNGPKDCVNEMIAAFKKRREVIYKKLKAIDKVTTSLPEGAFYMFPDISAFNLDSLKFCDQLLEKANVAAIPGIAFGADKNIRLSYATSLDQIELGLERIKEFCNNI